MDDNKSRHDELMTPNKEKMERFGIDDNCLFKQLKQELKAKEVRVFYNKDNDKIIYSKPLRAWSIQQRAREDAHKLRRDYPPEKKELTGDKGGPLELIMDFGEDDKSEE